MSSLPATVPVEFVCMIATDVAAGVDLAVESWMAQVEAAILDAHLTTLGRMNAVREVLQTYKTVTGKTELRCRDGRQLLAFPSGEAL
jgi:hypothetical protein